MEARRWVWTTFSLLLLSSTAWSAGDATFRTSNFVVHAPSQEFAKQVAECAEVWREELAVQWLGKTLPRWYEPCQVRVTVGQIGAGGSTTFSFEGGEVFGWNMKVQGTRERILDSVIPHEVSHTIFACHFRRPLPRWADEGAATLVEHTSEKHRQVEIFQQVKRNKQQIPLTQLLDIDEYPKDMQKVLALYAQGYSLVDFLVQHHGDKGRQVYLAFVADALSEGWEKAFRKHYGFETLKDLDLSWNQWVLAGSPPLRRPEGTLLAQNEPTSVTANSPAADVAEDDERGQIVAIRGQSAPASRSSDSRAVRGTRTQSQVTQAAASENAVRTASNTLPPTRRSRVAASNSGHSASPQRERIPLKLTPTQDVGD
jgi:hypothetical protein